LHSRSPALPRTYVGRWLRASMLDQRDLRDQLIVTLNGGSNVGWNDEEPAVVEAACELMLRRYFGPGGPGAPEVARLEALIYEATVRENRPIGNELIEAVIRAAIGEAADPIKNPVDQLRIQTAVASLLSVRSSLSPLAVDEIVREAERTAFERGWHPPLVPRRRSRDLSQ
jgi:hypothetical protein